MISKLTQNTHGDFLVLPPKSSVFYPASGRDLRAIRSFVLSGLADSFIQVDNLESRESIQEILTQDGLRLLSQEDWMNIVFKDDWGDENPQALLDIIRGTHPDYDLESMDEVAMDSIMPTGGVHHLSEEDLLFVDQPAEPFALLARYRKHAVHPAAQAWPQHLQLLFLRMEAHHAYDMLYCQAGCQPPKAVVIPCGMHIPFDQGSSLASQTGQQPEFLLLLNAGHLVPWTGYTELPEWGADHQRDGMLFRRDVELLNG